eukprot:scaffold48070_cov74-Cyclotella_meneghiniana.AAC.2
MAPKRHRKSADAAAKQASYKRRRTSDQDYSHHAFLDASATVNAGLFSARRLPEIKSLWREIVDGKLSSSTAGGETRRVGESGGAKISSRHLRRRTGSHRPRRRHRFPRGDFKKSDDDSAPSEGVRKSEETSDESKPDDSGSVSMRSLDLRTRKKIKGTPCRRARRKPALLKASHSKWYAPSQTYPNPSSEIPQHKWIPTHHWHTKRFHIAKLFGWSVPLIHCNRGCRAAIRLAGEKCTVQDATWEVDGCALVLKIQKKKEEQTKTVMLEVVRVLRRICGTDASFLSDEDVLSGNEMGEGLVYEVDSFPTNLIGPAAFMFQSNSEAASVYMMVHPTIRLKAQSLLEAVVSSSDDYEATISIMPMSLLRIRGAASLTVMSDVLSIDRRLSMQNHKDMEGDIESDKEEILSHNMLVEHDVEDSFGNRTSPLLSAQQNTSIRMGFEHIISDLNPNKLFIKLHQPNTHIHDKLLPHNTASTGFDILCHPSITVDLFQSFVLSGACAIGLTEDARAQLEALPPLPSFPRDYPDTEAGRCYWEGSSGVIDEKVENATWMDWAVVRTCMEAPWGRMNTRLRKVLRHYELSKHAAEKPLESTETDSTKDDNENTTSNSTLVESSDCLGHQTAIISWSGLVPSANEDYCPVVVVRGGFGHPFLSILHGYGKFKSNISKSGKTHKLRRPSRSTVKASPLSKIQSEAHSNVCQNLLDALSLPAVLRCEIYCDDKGTLEPGDLLFQLYGNKDDSEDKSNGEEHSLVPLGVVSAGGFSPARGIVHGVGFIGAARFIQALMDSTVEGMVMKVNGSSRMMLKVHLRKLSPDCVGRSALISLLL